MEMDYTHMNATPSGAEEQLLTVENSQWGPALNSTQFMDGFLSSMSMIILAELGDRTFFIAAILAIKHPRVVVFLGQMLAQTAMTAASVALGLAAHLIPRSVLHYASIACFILFGCKMLYEARGLCLNVKESSESDHSDLEQNLNSEDTTRRNRRWHTLGFTAAFSMTIMAEWGDRSQIATIILAATKDVYAVALGAVIGHAICTLLAVLAGHAVAAYIPVRVLTLIGAIIFFVFAIVALISGPDEEHAATLNSTLTTASMFETTTFS